MAGGGEDQLLLLCKVTSYWSDYRVSLILTNHRPGEEQDSCNAKHGSPFGPFWSSFGVEFVRSEMFGPLGFSSSPANMKRQENRTYPFFY